MGRAGAEVIGGAGNLFGRALAESREQAEDLWADARAASKDAAGRDAAVYAGLAATAALGVVELPIAAAVGGGYALLRRHR